MKSGVTTTEFWLSLLVMVIGTATTVGLIPSDNSVAAKVASLIVMVLSALGYTYSRTTQKVALMNAPAQDPTPVQDSPTPPVAPQV